MLATVVGRLWVYDLPVCLPGRACVDQPSVGESIIQVTSTLTPLSPLIAAVFIAFIGITFALLVVGLRRQWRGRGLPQWEGGLFAALLLFGVWASWVVSIRLALIDAIYSDFFGQAAVAVPMGLIGSWPTVLLSCQVMAAVGGLALVSLLCGALVQRRRARATA